MPALDGLRGLAALVMVLYHLLVAGWASTPGLHLLQKFVTAGWVGVDLFFVLSGFLITGILLRSLDSPTYFRTFYTRRALRIFPLYYLVVLTAITFPRLLDLHWAGLQWLYLADLQNNLGFVHRSFHLEAIEHLWTLGLEEQFYLAWPLVLWLCRNRRHLLTASLLACGGALVLRIVFWALHTPQNLLANATPFRFDALLLGACLALALDDASAAALTPAQRVRLLSLARPVCIAALAAMLAAAFVRDTWANEDPFVYTVGFTLLDIFFAALMTLSIQPATATARLFSWGPLRTLGTYSYGLYVYHGLLSNRLTGPLRASFDAGHSKLFGVGAAAGIVLLLSLLAAVASYHLLEQPFLRLKRFFPYRAGRA